MQYVLELVPLPERIEVERAPRRRLQRAAPEQHRFRFIVKLSDPDTIRISKLALAAGFGDRHAAERLTNIYRPLILVMAKRISVPDLERIDVLACAMGGFVKAIRTYDARGGVPFDYYAKRLVSNALAEVVRQAKQKRVIPPSERCEFDPNLKAPARGESTGTLDDMRYAWQSVRHCSRGDRAWLMGITAAVLDEFERVLN